MKAAIEWLSCVCSPLYTVAPTILDTNSDESVLSRCLRIVLYFLNVGILII